MTASLPVRDSDVEALLRIVASRCDDELGEPLGWTIMTGLKALMGCDVMSFLDLDSETKSVSFEQSLPEGNSDDEDDSCFWQHYWDCLACSYPDRSGDLRSITKVSDFYGDADWHQQGMYVDCFRPSGIEREMMLCLPGGPGQTLRLIFFRGPGTDFTERDRGILTLLRPHLYHAYLDYEARRRGVPDLTPRQWELMRLLAAGYSNAQIAMRLFVSEGTVRKHLENIYQRLDVTSRMAAVERAIPERLLRRV